MDWMIMLAQLLLSLSFLVAVHEFGHLLAAKYFGMRVEQFSIGFPPKIWSFRKGETEYAISAIPLGGYVKISGMIDESLDTETMKQEPQPWEFRSKPAWQRLIVMLGGITVNVIVGVLIFIGLTYAFGDTYILKDEVNKHGGFQVGTVGESIGLKTGDKIVKINDQDYQYLQELVKPQTLLGENLSYTVERNGELIKIPVPGDFIKNFNKKENHLQFIGIRAPNYIGKIKEGMMADEIGLKQGDQLLDVNGTPIQYADQVPDLVQKTAGDTIQFTIKRGEEVLKFKEAFRDKNQKAIGIISWMIPEDYLKDAEVIKRYGFFESIPLGTKRAFETLQTQITAFGKVISGSISPKESLSGPIGIAQAFGVEWDWERFWSLTGVLSLVLAFMNLLPIPALDGGHVMFLTYEMISRRKPSDKFLETAQKVGMVFLLALMVFIFANDIIKLF
ncbi:RIP metalloprotease RseP [Chryseosolibacter indicus]|uniref:Zinc metalloprotease n=1 Tax=Chryseosolibacter indicus TaxID=2782351 RepID=A0ABS5W021_9BACT|nr:RIP metalloprotease RseP [Chryseosolibacter indicus]MBT1706460.1 RIP metalloprotease RseP [Chryseosolibacter indicus]